MIVDLNKIMDMLDWWQSEEIQKKGIELAHEVKCINTFILPMDADYNKNVWENCAKILANRSDEALKPYLSHLFEWLQDLTWPGTFIIIERLKRYERDSTFYFTLEKVMKIAKVVNEGMWYENLKLLYESDK